MVYINPIRRIFYGNIIYLWRHRLDDPAHSYCLLLDVQKGLHLKGCKTAMLLMKVYMIVYVYMCVGVCVCMNALILQS